MTETKFTPAPWELHERYNGILDIGKEGDFDDETGCNKVIAHAIDTESNANLIAAAPDLYVALEEILELCFFIAPDIQSNLIDNANKALAKALAKARGE